MLRLEMARLTEWVRILTYEGWVAGAERQNDTEPRERVTRRRRNRQQAAAANPERQPQDQPPDRGRRETPPPRREEAQAPRQATRGTPRRDTGPPTGPTA